MTRLNKFIAYFVCAASICLSVLIFSPVFVHAKALLEPTSAQAQTPPDNSFPATRQTTTLNNSLPEPPPNQGKPVEVAVGLYVTNLAGIDQVKETYDLSGYLFLTWKDPRLAFNPQQAATDTRIYKPGEIWDPYLVGFNIVDRRHSFNDQLIVKPDGTVEYEERFYITLAASLQLSFFPFDAQRLPMILQSFNYDKNQVLFLVNKRKIGWEKAEYVSLSEWQITGLDADTSSSIFSPEQVEYSRVIFQLKIKRNAGYYIWTFFLPLLLINIISWSVFWIDIRTAFSTRISIGISSLLSVIAFNIAIGDILPRVGYLTGTDAFIFFSYVFTSLSIFTTVYGHYFIAFKERQEEAIAIDHKCRWLFPLGFTVGNLILFTVLALK